MDDLETVFFIHVPKTAGTSFRVALEQKFSGRLAFDYGAKSPHTTEWVRQHVHETPNRDRFRRELTDRGIVAFGGHVSRSQYGDVFPPERTIAFVREPIARLISEWHHHRRHSGLTASLEDFAERPAMRNLQTRLLRGTPIERYAVLGLTNRYHESLDLVARRFGWVLPELELNRNPTQTTAAPTYEVSPDLSVRLKELNEADLRYYSAVQQHFESRASAVIAQRQAPAVPAVRGHIDGYSDGHVRGWACLIGDPTPLFVRILINNREVAHVTADRLRPDLYRKRIHPTGHAGFRVPVGPISSGTTIRCITAPVAFELTGSPFVVPRSRTPTSDD